MDGQGVYRSLAGAWAETLAAFVPSVQRERIDVFAGFLVLSQRVVARAPRGFSRQTTDESAFLRRLLNERIVE